MERKEIYSNDYMWLFNDWTMWISDWVGFVWDLSRDETYSLYIALCTLYNINN